MNKKFKYLNDPKDKGSFKFLFVASLMLFFGLFILFITAHNLTANNSDLSSISPRYGWFFLIIGFFLIFVYGIFPKAIKSWLSKLEIVDTDLIIKNPLKPLNKISIFDIDSVALRYEVSRISLYAGQGPVGVYRYFVRQWGYLVKMKNGQVYGIIQSINNSENFLKELQNINSSIRQNLELEEQSKQQAEEDFKKTVSFVLSKKIVWDKDL